MNTRKNSKRSYVSKVVWMAFAMLPLAACQIDGGEGATDDAESEVGAPGATCGGLSGAACGDGEFCDFALDALCGAADATGTCTPIPELCTLEFTPVCGCDGATYSNACAAHVAGVSVASEGDCTPPATGECGGLLGLSCEEGSYCNFALDALCGAADATGTCTPIPDVCTEEYAPVCGCDGTTYSNACDAARSGVSVASEGECAPTSPDNWCGGIIGRACEAGFYCDFAPETMCGSGDQPGTCLPTPEACTDEYNPVCGCDGATYGNACSAHAAGVSVAASGECPPSP